MSMITPPKAALFDLDGVLLDRDIHFRALNRALGLYGYGLDYETHEREYNGLPTRIKLAKLSEKEGLPFCLHESIEAEKQRITKEMIEELPPNKEAQELLFTLVIHSAKIGVVSNARRESVFAILSVLGLLSLVNTYVGNEDAAPKPAPDLYLTCATKMGVAIEDCVIIEDSPVGIQAARAAGPRRVITVAGPEDVDISLLGEILS